MKLPRFLLVLFAATILTCQLDASPESHRAAIDQLFKVMKMEKQYEAGMLAGFDSGAGMTPERLAALPEEQRTKLQDALAKVKVRMQELMGWEVVKVEMTEIYMKKFSEEDATAISKMLETPTGQLLVTKQLEIIPEASAFAQKKARDIMPEIIKMVSEGMK